MDNVRAYVEALASAAPTPGGGSAAALAGSMAAGLVTMVCRVTAGKPRFLEEEGELTEVAREALGLSSRLLQLAEDDADAYDGVVAAYRLPKGTGADQSVRREAVQAALIRATEVPLETALACGNVLFLAGRIVDKIYPKTFSDLGTAVALADAGLQGARLNVMTNVTDLDDDGFAKSAVQGLNSLDAAATGLKAAVLARCTAGVPAA